MTLHEQYHDLAEKSLQCGHIDAEAYLVKVISEMVMNKKEYSETESVTTNDRVPESRIDEQIDTMQDMFVVYMKDKSVDNLKEFLTQSKRILSEVFHDCDTVEKRNLCKEIFDQIGKI